MVDTNEENYSDFYDNKPKHNDFYDIDLNFKPVRNELNYNYKKYIPTSFGFKRDIKDQMNDIYKDSSKIEVQYITKHIRLPYNDYINHYYKDQPSINYPNGKRYYLSEEDFDNSPEELFILSIYKKFFIEITVNGLIVDGKIHGTNDEMTKFIYEEDVSLYGVYKKLRLLLLKNQYVIDALKKLGLYNNDKIYTYDIFFGLFKTILIKPKYLNAQKNENDELLWKKDEKDDDLYIPIDRKYLNSVDEQMILIRLFFKDFVKNPINIEQIKLAKNSENTSSATNNVVDMFASRHHNIRSLVQKYVQKKPNTIYTKRAKVLRQIQGRHGHPKKTKRNNNKNSKTKRHQKDFSNKTKKN